MYNLHSIFFVSNHLYINHLTLTRRPVEDPEVKEFLRMDEELFNDIGSGVLEDAFPYFKDVFPSAKWKKVAGNLDKVMTILRTKFKEHVETFEPGWSLSNAVVILYS
jgi:hypothetical protein